jgi:hypothetical protein
LSAHEFDLQTRKRRSDEKGLTKHLLFSSSSLVPVAEQSGTSWMRPITIGRRKNVSMCRAASGSRGPRAVERKTYVASQRVKTIVQLLRRRADLGASTGGHDEARRRTDTGGVVGVEHLVGVALRHGVARVFEAFAVRERSASARSAGGAIRLGVAPGLALNENEETGGGCIRDGLNEQGEGKESEVNARREEPCRTGRPGRGSSRPSTREERRVR